MVKTMDSRVVMGWILEYLAHVFWDEFKRQNTLDNDSERQLFQGILCQKMDINTNRCRLVNFLLLLVRLVDGRDVDATYKDDQQDTPLEDALKCLDSIMLDLECDCTQNEVEQFRDIMKEQAVIVCCRSENFDKAHRVFLSVIGDSVQENTSKADSRSKVLRQLQSFIKAKKVNQRFLDLHSYEDFLEEAKTFLQKIYSTFGPSMLVLAQRKVERKQGIIEDTDDDGLLSSMVDASSKSDEGTSSRRSSPLKGLRALSRRRLDRGDHRVSDETPTEDDLPTSDPQNENNNRVGTLNGQRVRSPLKRKCRGTNGHSTGSDTGVYSLVVLKAATPSLTDEDWTDIRRTSDLMQKKSSPLKKKAKLNVSSDASAPALDPQSQSLFAGLDPQFSNDRGPPSQAASAPALDRRQSPIAGPEPQGSNDRGRTSTAASAPALDQSQSPIAGPEPQGSNDRGRTSPAASTPKRGRSIRNLQYQPNRNKVRVNGSSPERAADTADDQSSWSGSEITLQSNKSFPILRSPRVRRSLDPGQVFRHLSKKKQFWTPDECQLLKEAIKHFGPGKWSEMRLAYDFNGRTNVNLKDKWRNMVKNGEV